MKKLLIIATIAISPSVFAELRLNTATGMFYSQGAEKDVDQVEYNKLIVSINQLILREPGKPFINLFGQIFAELRIIGTPAAIRIIHDFQELVKTTSDDMVMLFDN